MKLKQQSWRDNIASRVIVGNNKMATTGLITGDVFWINGRKFHCFGGDGNKITSFDGDKFVFMKRSDDTFVEMDASMLD
tara:strand:- start:684 stop:920 length:237 start_codon:yes stop_codon:yes gene_type:complete